jgi:TonB family protein
MAQTAPVVAPITAPDASLPSEPEPVAVARQIPKVPVQEVPVAEDDENLEALFHGYMRAVHQRVRRSKKYPRAAIRAGIEGRVELAIVIDGSGHILECRVHKSSGIDVLDRAAVKTVSRVGNLPAPPAQLGWERRTVYVPFIYKLS